MLATPVGWFFENVEPGAPSAELSCRQRMCLELARNFAAIESEKQQQALSQMARSLVPERDGDAAPDPAPE